MSPRRPAQIDVDDQIQFFRRRFLEGLGNGRSGIVDEDVEATEGRHGLLDGVLYGRRIGGIGLDGQGVAARFLNAFHDRRGGLRTFRIGDGDAGTVRGETPGDAGADPARSAGDQGDLAR